MNAALTPVTVGFLPLLDAGLLVAAREEGFAAAEGLDLKLAREGSWAAVRDKLNAGLFDAAHMLAPAAIAATLGVGHLKTPMAVAAGLNLDGNAITVSRSLAKRFKAKAKDGLSPAQSAALLAEIVTTRAKRGEEPLIIGVVFSFSCHLYQMRHWLKLGGVDPEQDVRFVVIPPPLMVESLALGQIDMFCAGAPWNRLAETRGAGSVLHPCADILPDCPEKWLVMPEHAAGTPVARALGRALQAAASWCGDPANHPLLARHLARPDYVGTPVSVIAPLLEAGNATLGGVSPRPWIRLDRGVTDVTEQALQRLHQMMADAGHVAGDRGTLARLMGLVTASAG
jgi:NitT/TauT family transport system ATP-binding protein